MRNPFREPGDELPEGSHLEAEELADLPGVPASNQLHDELPEGSHLDGDSVTDSADPHTQAFTRAVRPQLGKEAATVWQGVGKGIVQGVGGVLNMWLAADEKDKIWLPDDAETKQMGEPLGRIIGRRAPLPGGDGDAGDIADGIAIAIGLVGYGVRNLFEGLKRRRERNRKPPQVLKLVDDYAEYPDGVA